MFWMSWICWTYPVNQDSSDKRLSDKRLSFGFPTKHVISSWWWLVNYYWVGALIRWSCLRRCGFDGCLMFEVTSCWEMEMDVSLKSLETGFSWKTEEINGGFNLETLDSETYQNDGVFGPLKTSGWNHRKLLRPSECLNAGRHFTRRVLLHRSQLMLCKKKTRGKEALSLCVTKHRCVIKHNDYMGVSLNGGIPKWMIYNGKVYQNGWFGGKTHH